jgi:two-component sensor histidine kinase
VDIPEILIPPKTGSVLGIIVNELITNTMKYAFQNRERGEILLRVTTEPPIIRLIYQDDGVGIPETINFENTTGFGMNLIRNLCRQIEAEVTLIRENGTRFVIEFKPEMTEPVSPDQEMH